MIGLVAGFVLGAASSIVGQWIARRRTANEVATLTVDPKASDETLAAQLLAAIRRGQGETLAAQLLAEIRRCQVEGRLP